MADCVEVVVRVWTTIEPSACVEDVSLVMIVGGGVDIEKEVGMIVGV